jgi:hypothetical protein
VGHRAAAKMADLRLTPAARAAVRDLLEPGETLADASTWADEHRQELPDTAPWHYVNVPITVAHYDARFCPAQGCVVSKITDFRAVLGDPKATKDQKRQALRFLVHFVEDLHQPVHVGDRMDRGGNDLQVQFFDEGSNLHRVWDFDVIEHECSDEDHWAAELTALASPARAAAWCRGTPADWADESLACAKRAYGNGSTGQPLKAGAKLGEDYHAFALPIIRERLAQSGSRLAWILNDTFR